MPIIHASIEHDEQGQPHVVTDDDRPDRPRTDWARLEAMTDEEVQRNAEDDPDAAPLNDEQLSRLRLVSAIRSLRRDLRLAPEDFADRFGFDLATFTDWERGRRAPDATALILLRLIAQQPEFVARVVQESRAGKADAAD